MLTEYNSHLFGMNKEVRLKKDNIIFETVITGVSQEGRLLSKDVMERSFDFDEVEWVL
jgi:BirA family biotin operon repressor/biotin-[acetyl-CoA-carboxylase] ligase